MPGDDDTTPAADGFEPVPAETAQVDRQLEADGMAWATRVPDTRHLDALAHTLAATLDVPSAAEPVSDAPPRGEAPARRLSGTPAPSPLAYFRTRSRAQNALSAVAMVAVVGLMGALFLGLAHRGPPSSAQTNGTPLASATAHSTSTLSPSLPATPSPTGAAPSKSGTVLWRFQTGNILESSLAVANGVVYIGGADANLYAVSSATGERLWAVSVGATVQGPVTAANGLVYLTGVDGGVYAFSAKDGTLVWREKPASASFGAASIVNGVVYVGSTNNDASPSKLYALNAQTGATLWTFQTGGSANAAAVSGGVLFATSLDHSLAGSFTAYAISLSSHTLLWQTPVHGFGLTVSNDIVYIGGSSADLMALNATSGKQLWDVTLDSHTEIGVTPPVVADGVAYVGTGSGTLYALDAASGTKLWSYLTSGELFFPPAVLNATAYLGSVDGSIYALRSPGKLVWRYETGGQVEVPATIADGVVYIGSNDHNVYALVA